MELVYINQLAFIVAAMFGGFAHYLKKYLKKEIDIEFYHWFGKENLAATLYTMIVFTFAIIGALAFDIINKETGIWAVLYTGFVTGFAIDSGFNSDGSSMTAHLANTKSEMAKMKAQQSKPVPVLREVIAEADVEEKASDTA